MSAYMIVDVEVTDPAGYEEYRAQVPATLEPYQGRFLVRGGAVQVFEGDWPAAAHRGAGVPQCRPGQGLVRLTRVPAHLADPPAMRPFEASAGRGSAACVIPPDKDPAAASRSQDRSEDALEHLTRHPGMGRPGRVDGTRELVVTGTSYIVPYRVRGEQVEVVAILHSARQWPQSFD